MNTAIQLALVIGTAISFPGWCLLSMLIIAVIAYRHSRHFKTYVDNLVVRVGIKRDQLLGRSLFTGITGYQGFSIQFEIFEQNLTARVRAFLSKLRNTLKIDR